MKYPELFTPFQIGSLTIKNRIAMSPMHISGREDSDGNINDTIIRFYEERAKGGAGLIFSNSHAVNGSLELTYGNLDAFSDIVKFQSTTQRLTDRLHAYDAKFFMQIGAGAGRAMFPGAMRPEMGGRPLAPSEVPSRWQPDILCRPVTKDEIRRMIDAQVEAAYKAKDTGIDGFCLGGAYGGYFSDQFMIQVYNTRDDEYGYDGNGGQLRTSTEVIRGIKQLCGSNFPICIRLAVKHYAKGPGQAALPGEEFIEYERDVEESIQIAKALEAVGADAILIGNGSYESFYWLYPPTYQKEGLWLEDAKKIRDAVNIPIICPGKLNTPELANRAIKESYIDCVAIGRPSLADPEWANKARAGRDEDIRPCIGCNVGCIGRIFTGGVLTCAVNPTVFAEASAEIVPAQKKKRVAVIGGGLGGMEAARVAAQKGHTVDLYEGSNQLGGNFQLAAVPDFKSDADHRLLAWYQKAVSDAGVNVHLNTWISANSAELESADEIVVATGATPKFIPFKGIETCRSLSASDVLKGADPGEQVIIIGGGLVGCEVAVWLAKQSKKVTLLEAMPELMSAKVPTPTPNFLMMKDMLVAEHVDIYTSAQIQYLDDNTVIFHAPDGEHRIAADSIIQSVGFRSDDSLYQALSKTSAVPVWNVGDSKDPTNVLTAIRDGFFVGNNI